MVFLTLWFISITTFKALNDTKSTNILTVTRFHISLSKEIWWKYPQECCDFLKEQIAIFLNIKRARNEKQPCGFTNSVQGGSWNEGSAPDTEGRIKAAPSVKANKKVRETAVGQEHVKRIRKKYKHTCHGLVKHSMSFSCERLEIRQMTHQK